MAMATYGDIPFIVDAWIDVKVVVEYTNAYKVDFTDSVEARKYRGNVKTMLVDKDKCTKEK